MPGMQYIEGLVSNLNITEIVDTIIARERIPVTFLESDKELKMQQVTAYKAVLAKFMALQTQASILRKASSFNRALIEVSDETILSADSSGDFAPGTYNLRVTSLACNHQMASQGFNEAAADIFGTGEIHISIGSSSPVVINIEEGNNNLVGIKNAINESNAGVTASIINDGSSSQPYRLMLMADKTGRANDIRVEVSLSGGETLDFESSRFDNPEELSFAATSTSQVSLGATASYSGSVNKIYTFTVGGSGSQTIGEDNITINWTDGTNSGAILVTQADAEYELMGEGSDGLKLSFSAGDLTAGDTFQVSTFAPLLQQASDARIEVGGGSGYGSSIIVNSETNEFQDVIPGMSINVKNITAPGESVIIKSELDTSGLRAMIEAFVDKFNGIIEFINDQFTYNPDTAESGVLFADYSLQMMESSLRSAATMRVDGLYDEINSLSSIGIRTGQNGKLSIANGARLNEIIAGRTEELAKLFIDSGVSSTPLIEFISMSRATAAGEEYEVDITQAASKGFLQGNMIDDPGVNAIHLDGTNNVIKLNVDGVVSDEIVLTEGTYSSGADLAEEIQARISADARIGTSGVVVAWVDGGDTGYIKITSGSFGSRSTVRCVNTVANAAHNILGLAGGTVHTGQDVAGTINGEAATGKGQILVGNEGNATTEGLKLQINLTDDQLSSGAEGVISITKGLASRLEGALDNITKSVDGSIARRTLALNRQIEAIADNISDYDERLERRREELYKQFLAMEEALSSYQSMGSYLELSLIHI